MITRRLIKNIKSKKKEVVRKKIISFETGSGVCACVNMVTTDKYVPSCGVKLVSYKETMLN